MISKFKLKNMNIIFLNCGQNNTLHFFNSKRKEHYICDNEYPIHLGHGYERGLKQFINTIEYLVYLK